MSRIKKLGVGIVAFEGCEHLKNIISEIKESVDYVLVGLQHLSYHGDPIDPRDIEETEMCKNAGLIDEIYWYEPDLSYLKDPQYTPHYPRFLETEKRNNLIDILKDRGCSHCLIIDGDEFIIKDELDKAKDLIHNDPDIHISYCPYIFYYKDYEHLIKKDGPNYAPFISEVDYKFEFGNESYKIRADLTRKYLIPVGESPYIFPIDDLCIHNLAYIRLNIEKKMDAWSSKLFFNKIPGLKDACLSNFYKYQNEDKSIIYTSLTAHQAEIIKCERKVFPKYELDEKL